MRVLVWVSVFVFVSVLVSLWTSVLVCGVRGVCQGYAWRARIGIPKRPALVRNLFGQVRSRDALVVVAGWVRNGANRMCQLCHALPNARCVACPGGRLSQAVRDQRRRVWCPPTTLHWRTRSSIISVMLQGLRHLFQLNKRGALGVLFAPNSTNVNKLAGFSMGGAILEPEAEDFGASNWAK